MAAAEGLARSALDWLVGSARSTDAGLTWASTAIDDEVDHTLYSGASGIVLALLEAQRHFADDRYGDAAVRGAAGVVYIHLRATTHRNGTGPSGS